MADDSRSNLPELEALAKFEATIQHLELLHRKIVKLEEAKVAAEEQLCHAVHTELTSGSIEEDDLIEAYAHIKRRLPLPFAKRWNAVMPITAQTAWSRALWREKYRMNGPGGRSWIGERPVGEWAHMPRPGVAVVYVLYDARHEPIYLGSTGNFRQRITAHERGDKPWVSYMATPCADREAAYQLEDHYLRTRKPPANIKASR